MPGARRQADSARFLHVSTDEVYGSLGPTDPAFTESSPYRPNSPYAASKAASDHLVRSFVETYKLPALITNCSNNYGPYQHPEKLIPLMIIHALEGKPLPIYGDGSNVRDWLHVSDHCGALINVIERGRVGETYNVGGGNERNNRDVVGLICDTIDRAFAADASLASRFPSCPAAAGGSCRSLISFVTDRPGHDHRYAINAAKLAAELDSRCSIDFAGGLGQTVRWYLDHEDMVARRHQRRLQGLDRQELRFPDRGLDSHAHPRAQRGLSALSVWLYRRQPGLEKRVLCRPDGGAKRQPVRRRRFLFEEFRRARPPGGGNPRQQSLAAVGLGARTRHGGRRREPPPTQRQPPRFRHGCNAPSRRSSRCCGHWPARSALARSSTRRPKKSCSPRSRISGPTWCSTRTLFMSTPRLMRRIKAIGNPILIGQIGIEPSARRGLDRL